MLIDVDKEILKKKQQQQTDKQTNSLFVSLFEKILQRETNSHRNFAEQKYHVVISSSLLCASLSNKVMISAH